MNLKNGSTWNSIRAGTIVAQLASYVYKFKFPSWLTYAITAIDEMNLSQAYVNSSGWEEINNGTRCALFLQSTYEMQTTCVLISWASVPYIDIDCHATDVSVKVF